MIKLFKIFSILFICSSIIAVSCESDVDLRKISGDVSISPALVIPLGVMSVKAGDIFNDAKINGVEYGSSGEISYKIFDTLPDFVLPKIDLIKNAKNFQKLLQVPYTPLPVPPFSNITSEVFSEYLDLGINTDINSQRIDSLKISKAVLGVNVWVDDLNILPQNLVLVFSFGGKMMMADGSPGKLTFNPTKFNRVEDLTISNFSLITSAGAKGIPLDIQIIATTGSTPVIIKPTSKIHVEFKFKQMDWSVIYGKFDLSEILIEGKVGINLNSLLPKELAMEFSNPQIDIETRSNLGVKLGLKLDYLKTIGLQNNTFAKFNGASTMYSEFKYKPTSPNESVTNHLPTFDKTWGETDKLIAGKPDTLGYKFSATSVQNATPDFITPDAKIKVYMKLNIPFEFNAGSNFQYTDSISNVFDNLASTLDKFSNIDFGSTKLILNISNGFPVRTSLLLEFVDKDGVVIATDFEKNFDVEAGKVDADGNVFAGSENKQTLVISLNKDQLTQLEKADKIVYTVKIQGKDAGSKISFNKNNTFDLKVALFVKGVVTSGKLAR